MNQPALCQSAVRSFIRPALLILLGCTLVSCGASSDGPTRYVLRGEVKFDGQPVPKGFITFSPSEARGNQGPGGGAPIVNGQYETPRDKGIVGGAYDVRIVGHDGKPINMEGEELPDGMPLFSPYETTLDLPKSDSEHDFDVPRTAAQTGPETQSGSEGQAGP